MNLDKAPRWFLVIIAGSSVGLLGLFGGLTFRQAYADIGTLKTVAYEARNQSRSNDESIVELKGSMQEIRNAQETFRREYREDQKDLDKKLDELLRR